MHFWCILQKTFCCRRRSTTAGHQVVVLPNHCFRWLTASIGVWFVFDFYYLYTYIHIHVMNRTLSLTFTEEIQWKLGQHGRNRCDSMLPVRDCQISVVANSTRMSSTLFSEVFAFSPPLLDVHVPSVKPQNDALLPPRGERSKLPKAAAKFRSLLTWQPASLLHFLFHAHQLGDEFGLNSMLILEKQTGDTGGETCLIM